MCGLWWEWYRAVRELRRPVRIVRGGNCGGLRVGGEVQRRKAGRKWEGFGKGAVREKVNSRNRG